ncbi:MAG: tRNA uridine-5-carboxymethylaminomethyl(34) synthesis GTPase MnmE [Fusobacteriaceae bacterium]|jgi:tRNA modification GTPase|nr:tRNA uridine-5-carboxymethylaminomethyl(34) synthesis GTPase MnmE [Fusobacteriaceae bacterium]
MIFDTITAISTPVGDGGIGIVRISGEDALHILEKIFIPKSGKKINDLSNFSINYGHIHDNFSIIDEVLVSVMKGHKTYSGENIIEINCHGGYFLVNRILEIVLKNGVRLAEKGEFTRRGFLNGRIDLIQAEATIDIINSKNDKSNVLAINQLRGDLSDKIKSLKKLILDVAAHINVVLDYPEEGIDDPIPSNLVENLEIVKKEIGDLINSYESGKIIKDGIKTAIIGKPNVGKSSILNALIKEERAIVTNIPGTTRDVIEESIKIKGINLLLTDTAGIRNTNDFIENIGVTKAKEILKKADLILFIIDSSKELENEDIEIYNSLLEEKIDKTIGIINKIDIKKILHLDKVDKIKKWIEISALTNEGINKMENEIYDFIIKEKVEKYQNKIIITNIRHKSSLDKVMVAINNLLNIIREGFPMDLMAIDIRDALDYLGEITGEISSEDLLDHIFKNFCVGK